MSNSPLVTYTRISPNRNPRKGKIDTITIHCVAGQCSLETLGEIFAPTARQASSNYGIDPQGNVGMYAEEKDRSWCTSSRANDNRAVTIEVASDSFPPYAVKDAAMEGLIKLVADICKRNGIKELKWRDDKNLIGRPDLQNMTIHKWFSNTACPGEYLHSRHGYIAEEVNKLLAEEEEEDMTQERFNELMNGYLQQLAKQDPGAWSKDAREWAETEGLINGDEKGNRMYRKFLTREEMAQVLYNMNGK